MGVWSGGLWAGSTGKWGAPIAVTISSGAISVVGPGIYLVSTEGAAASDDLTTINGGSPGDEIILRAADGTKTVVVKHGAGIKIGADFSLDSAEDQVRLFKESGGAFWGGGLADNA